jgi:hypothetical protein
MLSNAKESSIVGDAVSSQSLVMSCKGQSLSREVILARLEDSGRSTVDELSVRRSTLDQVRQMIERQDPFASTAEPAKSSSLAAGVACPVPA